MSDTESSRGRGGGGGGGGRGWGGAMASGEGTRQGELRLNLGGPVLDTGKRRGRGL